MASAAAPLPAPEPRLPSARPIDLCVFGVELGDFLARARELGGDQADVVRLFRDESAAGERGQGAGASEALPPAALADGAGGTSRRRRKKQEVPLPKHSELVEIHAECEDCPWTANSSNAMGIAAQHARAHEHQVKVRQTQETTFERPHERDRAQLPLKGPDA